MSNQDSHIVFLTTIPLTARLFLKGHLSKLRASGFKVTLITSPGKGLEEFSQSEGVQIESVPMQREIYPLRDLIALFKLVILIRKLGPNIVNAGTPKAGLLGMLAARIAGVPIRVFQQRGLRLETTHGIKRMILLITEWLTVSSASKVVCNSHSLKEACIKLNMTDKNKYLVLGRGSSNGVDIQKFKPPSAIEKKDARNALDFELTQEDIIIGFVGRLTRDKGILDLLNCFGKLRNEHSNIVLVLVGPMESSDGLPDSAIAQINNEDRIYHFGFVEDTSIFYHAFDFIVFPSYREGFPNVPLEAAATGIPVIGYDVTGTRDAIENLETGFLVEQGDIQMLVERTQELISNSELRQEMGHNGRRKCLAFYSQSIVHENWLHFYLALTAN